MINQFQISTLQQRSFKTQLIRKSHNTYLSGTRKSKWHQMQLNRFRLFRGRTLIPWLEPLEVTFWPKSITSTVFIGMERKNLKNLDPSSGKKLCQVQCTNNSGINFFVTMTDLKLFYYKILKILSTNEKKLQCNPLLLSSIIIQENFFYSTPFNPMRKIRQLLGS